MRPWPMPDGPESNHLSSLETGRLPAQFCFCDTEFDLLRLKYNKIIPYTERIPLRALQASGSHTIFRIDDPGRDES